MKYLVIFSTMFLAGCGQLERTTAYYTGYSEICVDNVKYLQFTSGASVKYDENGDVASCK